MKITSYFSLCALVVASLLPSVTTSPYVISDDRVRSLDITPVLGRGYSIMTNSFQSTCLDVKNTTVPSYNYDCKYNSNYNFYFQGSFLCEILIIPFLARH